MLESAVHRQPKGADLRHIRCWVFDLDHTLYTLDEDREAGMSERITLYVQTLLGLERDPAWALQKRYLEEYGTTLNGLRIHHHVDPDAYHDFINDIDALGLGPDAALRAGLERLPGERLIFTNNCGRFAARVVALLGVADLFAGIVDAQAMRYVAKPAPEVYVLLASRAGVVPEAVALFDDSARNLAPAHALGMTTIWFNNGGGQSRRRLAGADKYIDYETGDLPAFLQSIDVAAA